MARLLKTKVTKKKAKITFEFEHNGKTHQKTSTLDAETFWKLSERDLKNHIRVRANHERKKIDTPREKTKKEEQEAQGSNESESENLDATHKGTQNKTLEPSERRKSDLEEEQDQ